MRRKPPLPGTFVVYLWQTDTDRDVAVYRVAVTRSNSRKALVQREVSTIAEACAVARETIYGEARANA